MEHLNGFQTMLRLGHGFLQATISSCALLNRIVRTLTSATCNDTLPTFLLRQARHKVIRPSNFKAENFLQVLSLEPYLIPEFRTEVGSKNERCFL